MSFLDPNLFADDGSIFFQKLQTIGSYGWGRFSAVNRYAKTSMQKNGMQKTDY